MPVNAPEFVNPFRDGPLVEFVHRSRPGWTCTACTEQHPLLLSMRDIDRHLLEKHPGWGEARVETR